MFNLHTAKNSLFKKNFNFLRVRLKSLKKGQISEDFQKYAEILLFNSIIESSYLKLGYKNNMKILSKTKVFEEKLNRARRTIQPLPVSLKYLSEHPVQSEEPENEATTQTESEEIKVNFPYETHDNFNSEQENTKQHLSEADEVLSRKEMLKDDMTNWMNYYENYEHDLTGPSDKQIIREYDDWSINYGTPDPKFKVTGFPCGGCGAHLHCKDTAIPGYIPSEILKNCYHSDGADLGTVLCQRCHFLKEYNIALQVRVSPEEYPKILNSISFQSALVILMVDLTDFPCSIWPGIADILGRKTRLIVVGNKIDLIPKDDKMYLKRIEKSLHDYVKLCGFGSANIKHIELISAKTGFGVENLISSIGKVWGNKGDVYLIGCTNVGKSTLFNILLQSDFCKVQAANLIQKATTSPWPGTTLNLLKFPITNLSGYRSYLRAERLKKLQKVEELEKNVQRTNIGKRNDADYATITGTIERSFSAPVGGEEQELFSMGTYGNLSGRSTLGVDEFHSDFIYGRWCFDTPGVVHPDQVLNLLTTEELVKTLPRRLIRPESFCVKPGTSIFIAGLARLDYLQGSGSVRLTVFRSNDLPITICNTNVADSTYESLLRTELLGVPSNKTERLKMWPGLEMAKSFTITGKTWKVSTSDVVLSSAGWIAINCGPRSYEFQAWTPQKRGVYVRDCLLPNAVLLRGGRVRNSVAYKAHRFI